MTDEISKVVQYRKRPVVIEAMRFDGTKSSAAAICTWANDGDVNKGYEDPTITYSTRGDRPGEAFDMVIWTLEGDMTASPGDWIIKGVKGEFYPCKPDIFAATYEPAAHPSRSVVDEAMVGERHVRHEGGGVIALYEGDQRIREIGVAFTTGWDHRDRDEFIVRYNDYATLARQLAEARNRIEAAESIAAADGTLHGAIDYWQARAEQAEAQLAEAEEDRATARRAAIANEQEAERLGIQLAEATRRLEEVEKLVSGWRKEDLKRPFDHIANMRADELEAALTKKE